MTLIGGVDRERGAAGPVGLGRAGEKEGRREKGKELGRAKRQKEVG
jgi:hypothetical protein